MFIDDNSICRLLKDRDSRGLELLFKYYYRPLVLWADTFLNDIPASEDLVQEFFVSFWEKHSYERITSGNLRGYIFVSVRNQSLKFLEKRDPLRVRRFMFRCSYPKNMVRWLKSTSWAISRKKCFRRLRRKFKGCLHV